MYRAWHCCPLSLVHWQNHLRLAAGNQTGYFSKGHHFKYSFICVRAGDCAKYNETQRAVYALNSIAIKYDLKISLIETKAVVMKESSGQVSYLSLFPPPHGIHAISGIHNSSIQMYYMSNEGNRPPC